MSTGDGKEVEGSFREEIPGLRISAADYGVEVGVSVQRSRIGDRLEAAWFVGD